MSPTGNSVLSKFLNAPRLVERMASGVVPEAANEKEGRLFLEGNGDPLFILPWRMKPGGKKGTKAALLSLCDVSGLGSLRNVW